MLNKMQNLDTSWLQPDLKVWVELPDYNQSSVEVFILCKLQSIDKSINKAFLQNLSFQSPITSTLEKIFPINKNSEETYEDMVDMENLNEAELLYNIKKRYELNEIFTYVGPTLLAVNPYQYIEKILSKNTLEYYQKKVLEATFSLKQHPPHVYSLTALAMRQLELTNKNQAIVISGESGAGKTENTKFSMKFITSLGKLRRNSLMGQIIEKESIEDKILSCNPILEAFGNAKTNRNDNSSRFGKLVLLLIDKNNRMTKGAVITNYLLEKSRIIQQSKGERSYHIFYHILKGGSKILLDKLGLKEAKNYEYLNKSGCYEVSTVNDIDLFKEIENSFGVMKFSEEEIFGIWSIVASVLHLGNIDYDEKTYDAQNNKPCSIVNLVNFEMGLKLLGLTKEKTIDALTLKTRKINANVYKTPINKQDCISLRDSLTKNLYEKLFIHLIKRLNFSISTPEYKNISIEKLMGDKSRFSISLLDIFGFEVFVKNSFEQFCINFANEKLHQLYISYVFKAEINDFIAEGLKDFINELSYKDNQLLIDLFEALPTGIFFLLDEASAVASSDESLLGNISKSYKNHELIKIPKGSRENFIITHTAKEVEYCINGFRIKNKDEISIEIVNLLKESDFKYISDIFLTENESGDTKAKTEKYLGAKFRTQMKELMTELNSSDVHFIRCIKPNEEKKKNYWIAGLALNQIRYLGVLDSIKVRKEGYPIRILYENFYNRFFELDPNNKKIQKDENLDFVEKTKIIVNKVMPQFDSKSILYGKTKIFLRIPANSYIENALNNYIKMKSNMAAKIQHNYRVHVKRRHLRHIFNGIKRIQTLFKVRAEYKKFKNLQKKVRIIQKFYRKKKFQLNLKNFFEQLREKKKLCTKLSSLYKMKIEHKKFQKKKKAIILINKGIRNFLARSKELNRLFCKNLIKIGVIFESAWKIILKKIEEKSVRLIQRVYRGYLSRKANKEKIEKLKMIMFNKKSEKAAKIINKIGRGHIVRSRNRFYKNSILKIQGFMRTKWLRELFLEVKKATRKIQGMAKRWLLNRHINKEQWLVFKNNVIDVFEKLKNDEATLLCGDDKIMPIKDLEEKIIRNNTKKDSPRLKISEIKNEEQFLQYLDSQKDSDNMVFQNETNTDEDQIADILTYNKNTNNFQNLSPTKNPQFDISGRKIILFPLLLDFELLTDISDIYDPTWSEQYLSAKSFLTQKEEFFQIIEVGETFTLAATDSGNIYSWGSNDFNELGSKTSNCIDLPFGLKQPQKLIAGDNYSFIIDINGNIGCWGCNDTGQLGLGNTKTIEKAVLHPILSQIKVRDIQTKGSNFNIALLDDGKILFWPFQRSNGKKIYKPIELPIPDIKITSLSCGNNFAILLSAGGLLFSFGKENGQGQLGLGDLEPRNLPCLITTLKNQKEMIKQISCGFKHTIAKTGVGKVFVWGASDLGQLGLGNFDNELTPKILNINNIEKMKSKVVQVKAGFKSSIILLENGKIYWWGSNSRLEKKNKPIELDYLSKIQCDNNDKIDNSDFIPIRLLSTWSRTMSILYVTIADTREIDKFHHLVETRKICNTLSSYWDSQTIDPPYNDSISRHFSFKALKRVVFRKPEKISCLPSIYSPQKLTKIEKEQILSLFNMVKTQNNPQTNIHSNLLRVKSPGRLDKLIEKSKDSKLIEIKAKVIELLKKSKSEWNEYENKLMTLIGTSKMLSLIKNI